MTLRALARGSLLVTAGNLIPRAGAFLLLPIYASFLTRAEFGTVSLAGSAALLLAITYRLGLDAALLRLHHDLEAGDRRSLYTTIVAMSLACAAAVTALGTLGVAVLAPQIDPAIVPVALLALAIGAVNTFQYVPSVWFRATDQPARYFVLALGAFAAVVAVTVALVVVLRLGTVGSLVGQLAGAGVMAAVAAAILWGQRPWRLRADLARRALDFGLPLLPHTLAGWVLNVSDRWLLGLLLGLTAGEALAAIGVYSLGYQLGYAIALVAVSFNAAWLPFLYRVADEDRGPTVVREGTTLVVAGFLALAAVVAILAPDLVGLIAPPEWIAAADVTAVVAFASALNAAGLMLASGIYLSRTTRGMPLITALAALANVTLNLVLIPRIGVMGAAWATLAAYATLAVLTWLVSRRAYPARLDAVPLVAAAIVTVGATLVARVVVPPGVPVELLWHLGLATAAVLGVALLMRAPAGRLRAALAGASGPGGAPGRLG